MRVTLRPWAAFAAGATLFLAVSTACRLASSALALGATASHALLKTSLLLVSLLAMAADGRGFAAFGFARPTGARWGRVAAVGLSLGALATALILATPAKGLPMVREMGFLAVVLGVWLGSSLAEEVLTRGLVQSVIAPGGKPIWGLSPPVLASGLLFGALHLSLAVRGADPWTVAILVPATTALGLVAARFREVTGSLWPALVVHIAFNLGSGLAGVVGVLIQKLTERVAS